MCVYVSARLLRMTCVHLIRPYRIEDDAGSISTTTTTTKTHYFRPLSLIPSSAQHTRQNEIGYSIQYVLHITKCVNSFQCAVPFSLSPYLSLSPFFTLHLPSHFQSLHVSRSFHKIDWMNFTQQHKQSLDKRKLFELLAAAAWYTVDRDVSMYRSHRHIHINAHTRDMRNAVVCGSTNTLQ